MGQFNKVPPISETRHNMIPAQPGWFRISWEGEQENPEITKEPIVSWLVETDFYPHKYWNKKNVYVESGNQDRCSTVYPVTPGGAYFEEASDDQAMLGPDGCVYQLNRCGMHWPDIPSWVKWSHAEYIKHEKWDEEKLQREKAKAEVTS